MSPKLLLAPGETEDSPVEGLVESHTGGELLRANSEKLQEQRRIGAAVALRDLAEAIGNDLPDNPSADDRGWSKWIRQTLETHARGFDGFRVGEIVRLKPEVERFWDRLAHNRITDSGPVVEALSDGRYVVKLASPFGPITIAVPWEELERVGV